MKKEELLKRLKNPTCEDIAKERTAHKAVHLVLADFKSLGIIDKSVFSSQIGQAVLQATYSIEHLVIPQYDETDHRPDS